MDFSTLRVYRETLTTCFTRAGGALGDLVSAQKRMSCMTAAGEQEKWAANWRGIRTNRRWSAA